jgi:hypothetical protein
MSCIWLNKISFFFNFILNKVSHLSIFLSAAKKVLFVHVLQIWCPAGNPAIKDYTGKKLGRLRCSMPHTALFPFHKYLTEPFLPNCFRTTPGQHLACIFPAVVKRLKIYKPIARLRYNCMYSRNMEGS